jgi:hypothetical protein
MINFDYTTASRLSDAAIRAFDMIDALTDADDSIALRDLLIDRDAMPTDPSDAPLATYDRIRAALRDIDARIAYPAADSHRTRLSMLMLDESLCPMHAIDYAICFDDDDPDCATIRAFFPSHDT